MGWAVTDTTITNSYATGSVSGRNLTGGLVGYANRSSTVTNSYATGAVTGTGNDVGGLVGEADESTIENSYWDTETTGQDTSAGGSGAIGKTTKDMMKKATYSDWNFDEVWKIDEGKSYPTLR